VNGQFLDLGRVHLVLNCAACPDLPDFAGESLIGLSLDCHRAGGSFAVMHVSAGTRTSLIEMHVCAVIPVHGTLSEVTRTSCLCEACG
jgi:hypothetical protein